MSFSRKIKLHGQTQKLGSSVFQGFITWSRIKLPKNLIFD
jgi:hypothetical protein